MEASSASTQLPCFVTGTPLRVRSAGRSRQAAARPTVVAMAEQPKGVDRRSALATLAGFLAGVSFSRSAEAAIDSSALLEKYEKTKGKAAATKGPGKKAPTAPAAKPAPVAAPRTMPNPKPGSVLPPPPSPTPSPAPKPAAAPKAAAAPKPVPAPEPAPVVQPPPAEKAAASAGAASPSGFSPAVLGGAAALIAGALALGNSSKDSARAPRKMQGTMVTQRPVKKAPIRSGTVAVGRYAAPKRPDIRPKPKKVIPKPPPKKVVKPAVKKPAPPKRYTPPKRAAPPKRKAPTTKPDSKGGSSLVPVVGFGLALAAGLVFLSPGTKTAKKSPPAAKAPKPAAIQKAAPVAPPPVVASPPKPAPPVQATPTPAPPPAPKPAASKPKPKPSAAKRKQIVVAAKKNKSSGVSSGNIAGGIAVLAIAGSALYFLGDGQKGESTTSTSSPPTEAPAPPPVKEEPQVYAPEVKEEPKEEVAEEVQEDVGAGKVEAQAEEAPEAASEGLSAEEDIERRRKEADSWIEAYRKRSKKGIFGFLKRDD